MNEALEAIVNHIESLTRDYVSAYRALSESLTKESKSIAQSESAAKKDEIITNILIGLGIAGIGALALYFLNDIFKKDQKK